MATVLVTDGDERAALAVVRSLGSAGHRVLVTSSSGRSIAGASKFASAEHRLPSPLDRPDEFLASLAALVSDIGCEILIPIGEASLRVVLPHRTELDGVCVPFPPAETFRRISDKAAVLEAAERLGIPVPTLALAESADRLVALLGAWPDNRFPVVVKPTRSVVRVESGSRKTGVRYAESIEALRRIAEELDPAEFPVLLQRKVKGPGIGVFLLLWDGAVVAAFGHRRIREKPPSGGVSVLRESVELPVALVDASVALLKSFHWKGVAMVEYKLDAESGEHILMEINGRFWGSLQLAIDSGVDFPALLVSLALGKRPAPVVDYRAGVRTRWVLGDVDHLLSRLRRSKKGLGLDDSAPGRARVTLDFLRAFLPPNRSEVLRLGDPRPALREAASWFRALTPPRRG